MLLYDGDLAESDDGKLRRKPRTWKSASEAECLKGSVNKTKVMLGAKRKKGLNRARVA